MGLRELPVAVFDSGLGGVSVLRQLVRVLPGEDYLYYGDWRHAPYGLRPVEEVRALCARAAETLMDRGVKALVIACNTATSAAAAQLRQAHPERIIIGIEPAIKPAALAHPGGRVLVMATPRTLQEEKFFALRAQFAATADIVPVPCGGLMEFVERGQLRGPEVEAFLHGLLDPFLSSPADAVVLGCTHYPFLAAAIRRVVGPGPEILDGSLGVAAQLKRRLEEEDLLSGKDRGRAEFLGDGEDPEILARCRALLQDKED